MNDINFSNSFHFRTLIFDKFNYTDNRGGSPSHFFAYMISGNCKIISSSGITEIKEGDIFYIPDKCGYQSYWYGTPKIKFISLGFSYLPNFENRKYPVQVVPPSKSAKQLFFDIACSSHLTAQDIGLFYTLVGILLPTMSYNSLCRSKEIIEITKKYLLQHPFAKASELAKNCAISEAALYASFKKSSEFTPNLLRNQILLEKAKDMLISTDKTIEYISDYVGFSSASYFRKKFKSYFNMTPNEMRKTHKI